MTNHDFSIDGREYWASYGTDDASEGAKYETHLWYVTGYRGPSITWGHATKDEAISAAKALLLDPDDKQRECPECE